MELSHDEKNFILTLIAKLQISPLAQDANIVLGLSQTIAQKLTAKEENNDK